MPPPAPANHPTPVRIFETFNAFQKSAALRAAVDLDIFTAVARGNTTPAAIAKACGAADRGVRILCDFLVVFEFLTKQNGAYGLAPDAAIFLVKDSPAYVGGAVDFLHSATLIDAFANLTESVRRGGTSMPGKAIATETHEAWLLFARRMGPLLAPLAKLSADIIAARTGGKAEKILDLAASHGFFGFLTAKAHPNAELVAQDGAAVLAVTQENARAQGLDQRLKLLPGDAWEVDFGTGYDITLIPNLLHHYGAEDCERLLSKIHRSLKPGGVVAIIEFVPNDDRVTPPGAGAFALVMLADTPRGDAFTFSEYKGMLERTGFHDIASQSISETHSVILASR